MNQVKDFSNLIVALISGVSLLLVAYINKYHERKLKEKEWEKESLKTDLKKIKIELDTLTLFFSCDFYSFLDIQIQDLFKHTKASRFLLLFAINGKIDFNTATAAYEYTKTEQSAGATQKYVRLPLDAHYRDILKIVEKYKYFDINTEKLPKDSLLKQIYTSSKEQIKHSRVMFLKSYHVDKENDLILYASVGTHNKEKFTEDELYQISMTVSRISTKTEQIKFE